MITDICVVFMHFVKIRGTKKKQARLNEIFIVEKYCQYVCGKMGCWSSFRRINKFHVYIFKCRLMFVFDYFRNRHFDHVILYMKIYMKTNPLRLYHYKMENLIRGWQFLLKKSIRPSSPSYTEPKWQYI